MKLKGLLVVFLASIAFLHAEPAVEDTLIILSTGDIHGAIESFPRLATVVQAYRNTYPNVLLLNAGDMFTGSPYIDSAPERGQALTDMMQRLRYSASVWGNHELDYGQEVLLKRMKEAERIHFLCGNLEPSAYWEGYVSRSYECFFPKLNLKVLLFGLTNMESCNKQHLKGLRFAPLVRETYLPYQHIERGHGADMSICLSHMGLEHDELFAEMIPETDLIVGGHTHAVLPKGKDMGGSHIVHTGSRLQYLGVTRLVFAPRKLATEKPALLSRSTQLIALDASIPADPKYSQLLRHYQLKLDVDAVIGAAESELSHANLGALFCDALRESAQADIALYNRKGIRLLSMPAGKISLKDVLSLEPFRGELVVLEMRLGDIKELILRKYNKSNDDEAGKIDLYTSGFDYKIILNEQGVAVEVESPYSDAEKIFRVATGDYLALHYDFPQQGKAQPLGIMVQDGLRQYIKKHSPLKTNPQRAQIIPIPTTPTMPSLQDEPNTELSPQ